MSLRDISLKKRNSIFERAKFNRRRQNSGEPVDSFITALYCLVEHCKHGALRRNDSGQNCRGCVRQLIVRKDAVGLATYPCVTYSILIYVYDLMVVILINSYGYYCKQKPYCVCYISPYFV